MDFQVCWKLDKMHSRNVLMPLISAFLHGLCMQLVKLPCNSSNTYTSSVLPCTAAVIQVYHARSFVVQKTLKLRTVVFACVTFKGTFKIRIDIMTFFLTQVTGISGIMIHFYFSFSHRTSSRPGSPVPGLPRSSAQWKGNT